MNKIKIANIYDDKQKSLTKNLLKFKEQVH